MKLNPISIRQPISNDWKDLKKPNPPTPQAVEKAQFVDKTFQWKGSAAYKAANAKPSN